jgi:hypothetical protein
MNRKLLPILLMTIVVPAGAQNEDDDEQGRGVARISVISGDVSVRRGDSGDWTAAAINAPLVRDDRLVTGPGSRAEMQFDYANMIRLSADSEGRLADLENRRYLIQIAKGLVTFRVLRDSEAEVELATPSISIRPSRKGVYRIAVREDGTTEVTVRSGEAEMFTPKGSERVRAGRTVMARGTQSDPEFMYAARDLPEDEWDRWNERRDRDLERSRSYNYVSRDIYGAEELDSHGRWVSDPDYGYVWSPYVSANWAPYRAGRWSWIDWYGWTWVSYDPWGWAPYHYGRWYHHASWGWCWWPGGGPRYRTFWRPALVGFVGWNSYSGFNAGVGVGFGRVGWFPLGPRERFRPWYGRGYYGGRGGVNVVNNVNITNIYRNTRVNNGITAVDGADFSSGRVTRIHSVGRDDLSRASMVQGQLPITPSRDSLRLADREVRGWDSNGRNERFYSRREPSRVERVSFEDQRRGIEQLTARRGGDEGVRGGAGRAAEAVAGDSGRRGGDNGDRGGWRRVGSPDRTTEAGAAPRVTRTEDGGWRSAGTEDRGSWRRLGEGSGSAGGAGRRADSPAGVTRSDESGSRRGTGGNDRGGWRRFGEPENAPTPGAGVRNEDAGTRRSSGSGDRGGWRAFGEPRADSGDSAAGSAGRRMESNPDRGFGRPRRSEDSNRGWSRSSEGPRESRRSEPPQWSSESSPVRVNPPMVRERGSGSEGRRNYESGGGGRSSMPSWGGGRSSDGGGRMGGGRSSDGGGRSSGDSGGFGGGGGRSDGGGRSAGGGGRNR